MQPQVVDLMLAYDWPNDEPFMSLLAQVMEVSGLELGTAGSASLGMTFQRLGRSDLQAQAFLDRAARGICHQPRLDEVPFSQVVPCGLS